MLDLETYRALLETQEDADDVCAFDEGMGKLPGAEMLSIDQAEAEWAARGE